MKKVKKKSKKNWKEKEKKWKMILKVFNFESSNDDNRIQLIDSIGTYPYGTRKDLVSKKEEIKCNNII